MVASPRFSLNHGLYLWPRLDHHSLWSLWLFISEERKHNLHSKTSIKACEKKKVFVFLDLDRFWRFKGQHNFLLHKEDELCDVWWLLSFWWLLFFWFGIKIGFIFSFFVLYLDSRLRKHWLGKSEGRHHTNSICSEIKWSEIKFETSKILFQLLSYTE